MTAVIRIYENEVWLLSANKDALFRTSQLKPINRQRQYKKIV
jgi:hypothetical protein